MGKMETLKIIGNHTGKLKMKTIFFSIAIFVSFNSIGQSLSDFNYKDLKDITSPKLFKKFCFEKGYTKTSEDDYSLFYALDYQKDKDVANGFFYYDKFTDEFSISLAKDYDSSSAFSFKSVLNQVKTQCEFYDFYPFGGKEYIIYTCSDLPNKMKIGFFRGEHSDEIMFFQF